METRKRPVQGLVLKRASVRLEGISAFSGWV